MPRASPRGKTLSVPSANSGVLPSLRVTERAPSEGPQKGLPGRSFKHNPSPGAHKQPEDARVRLRQSVLTDQMVHGWECRIVSSGLGSRVTVLVQNTSQPRFGAFCFSVRNRINGFAASERCQ